MASNKTLRKYLKIDSLIIMGRWKDGNRMTKIKKMNKKLNLWRKLTEKKHWSKRVYTKSFIEIKDKENMSLFSSRILFYELYNYLLSWHVTFILLIIAIVIFRILLLLFLRLLIRLIGLTFFLFGLFFIIFLFFLAILFFFRSYEFLNWFLFI